MSDVLLFDASLLNCKCTTYEFTLVQENEMFVIKDFKGIDNESFINILSFFFVSRTEEKKRSVFSLCGLEYLTLIKFSCFDMLKPF